MNMVLKPLPISALRVKTTAQLTIHVSSVVQDRVQARPVPRVPDADAVVPAAGDEEPGHLRVPQQPPHRGGVASQHVNARLLCVVPHADRTETSTTTLLELN